METRETCVLTYATELGGQKNVRINDPRPGITPQAVASAGGSLEGLNVFDASIGRLAKLVGATIVTETITPLLPVA